MAANQSLLGGGWGMVARNLRYIFWFWLLNLTLAEFGASPFRKSVHAILDHSLYADKLLQGFDLSVKDELFARPEFGQMSAMTTPAFYFAFLFLVATALFLPGVFAAYASTYRLPREDFFRNCGRNLWRFIRLLIVAGVVMGFVAGVLFGISGAIVKKAGESTNELLPFELQMAGLTVIFLVMTTLRIWFDLAEADVVLSDQRAVRKSFSAGFKHTFRNLTRLLTSYVVTTLVAGIVLLGGLLAWLKLVAPASVLGAFVVGQITLFLLLIPRFWQRGIAVTYWRQEMLVPIAAIQPITPQPIAPEPVPLARQPAPMIPSTPSAIRES